MREIMRAALNGQDFYAIDSRLYIQDIIEDISCNVETFSRPAYGQYLASNLGHESLEITIKFMVKCCKRSDRQSVIQRVNGWAKEGWLELSTRPWKRIYVVCTQPAGNETFAWHDDMQITFTAYGESYWQDMEPATVTITGNGTGSISPKGTRPCYLEAKIKNTSSQTCNSISLSANGKTIAFEGLSLGAGKTLNLLYDNHHWLTAKIGNTGKLGCRTGASADDILLNPAAPNTITFSADKSCTANIIARGLYD